VSREMSEMSVSLTELSERLQKTEQELALNLEAFNLEQQRLQESMNQVQALTSDLDEKTGQLSQSESLRQAKEAQVIELQELIDYKINQIEQLECQLEQSFRDNDALRELLNNTSSSVNIFLNL
jgi:chromosome segregation ATPase